MIQPLKIIEKYYTKGSEIYHVLLKHSQHVCDKALSIAAKHPELQIDLEFIEEASMLHDIGIFQCYAPDIHCTGTHAYIEHGYLGSDLLRYEGLDRHALVCERHTGVGLTKEQIENNHLPLPKRDMIPASMEEKLICYADKFYSKSHLESEHSLEKIRKQLAHFGEDNVRIFNEWHEIFK